MRNALAPAKVKSVTLIDEERVANVLVAADQLSLAIGRGGQNVRLASRLTGWKINIQEDQAEAESTDAGDMTLEDSTPSEDIAEEGTN